MIDPYCGSGSTLVACKKLGRDFIGCDIKQEYVDIANKRLNETKKEETKQEVLKL